MDEVRDYGDSSVRAPAQEHQERVLGWALEAIQEKEAFLKGQPGVDRIDETIRAILSAPDPMMNASVPGPLSRTDCNQLGKIALDLRSGLTDTKIFWEYRTNNKRYEQSGVLATKRARAWWINQQCDMRFTDGISWCFAAGSAAMRLVYNREKGEQELQAWDPRDAAPIRPNSLLDYDDAFGVLLQKENTVNYLRSLYVGKRAYPGGPIITESMIRPDREGAFARLSTALDDFVDKIRSPLLRGVWGEQRAKTKLKVPSCDTFTIEVKDDSRNNTGHTILKGPHDRDGKPQANWCYAVEPKEPLYPRGRVIVLTRSCVLYDGPSIYWHGGFDVMKLTLDAWPFSWLGKSPIRDLLPLQDLLRESLRLLHNHIKKLGRPALIADKNNVSRAQWEKLDTSLAGLKALQNPSMGKGIQIVQENPQLLEALLPVMGFIIERMEFISGSKDVTNFAKLGQIPASETIERMMEVMSPAIRSRSRTLEAFLRPLAFKVLSNFMQFETMSKRIRCLGPEGAVLEDMDWDPGTMVPDYVHPEDLTISGTPTAAAQARGPRSRMERATLFMPQFDFIISPGSLLKASEISDKLLHLQLARAGWMDIWTLAERLGIQNFGAPPNGANTVTERLIAQMELGLAGTVSAAGRKASGQQMPQQRADGKIAES